MSGFVDLEKKYVSKDKNPTNPSNIFKKADENSVSLYYEHYKKLEQVKQ
jgi:hypothetical protein